MKDLKSIVDVRFAPRYGPDTDPGDVTYDDIVASFGEVLCSVHGVRVRGVMHSSRVKRGRK